MAKTTKDLTERNTLDDLLVVAAKAIRRAKEEAKALTGKAKTQKGQRVTFFLADDELQLIDAVVACYPVQFESSGDDNRSASIRVALQLACQYATHTTDAQKENDVLQLENVALKAQLQAIRRALGMGEEAEASALSCIDNPQMVQ